MNIIIVGWGDGAKPPYTKASANTRVVGAQVAKLINLIVSADLAYMSK
jgi:pancreatic triacylglycerol lipase